MIAKILVTLGTLTYTVGPPISDFNTSHAMHPDWPGHARFHEVWLVVTNSALGLLALYRLWRHDQLQLAALLSALVLGGFWAATAARFLYGGTLTDLQGIETQILGIDANAFLFSIASLLILAGWRLARRETRGAAA